MDLSALLKSIPLKRLLLYCMLLGLLPILAVAFVFFNRLENLDSIEQNIADMQLLALQKEKKQSVNRGIRLQFTEADHFYIDKYLESLVFLTPEIKNLEEISNNPNFTEDESLRTRLDFLTNGQNRLHFAEGALQSTPIYQEMVETAAHPVQIDVEDLKKILAYVEGVPIGSIEPLPGRPQLLFLDFKLDKKNNGPSGEVFLFNAKMLKREFL